MIIIHEDIYKNFKIFVNQDKVGNRKYTIEMLDIDNHQKFCHISLWALNEEFLNEDCGFVIHNQQDEFSEYDYYQENMDAHPQRNGLCSLLQEYLANNFNKLPFALDAIYSSKVDEALTEDGGKLFWDNQVKNGNAEFISKFNRYKLKLK